ncbi:MAG: hypothetical protein ACRDO9_12455 [Gaiellales bacterium]
MSVWLWILLGITGLFAVSVLLGLFVAAILDNIGRAFSELELEPFESSPLTESGESRSETAERRLVGGRTSGARLD